jgi:hypothetical protein
MQHRPFARQRLPRRNPLLTVNIRTDNGGKTDIAHENKKHDSKIRQSEFWHFLIPDS